MAAFTYAVRYDVVARCLSPFRTGDTGNNPEELLRDFDGTWLLQGTSIAGILRSWAQEYHPQQVERVFGCANSSADGRGSLVAVSDGRFTKDTEAQTRPRLKIDSRTGAGMDGHKFTMKHLPKDSVFQFTMLLKTIGRDMEAEGILEEVLSALHSGLITFGGQRSNGFGLVSLSVQRHDFDLLTQQGRQDWLEDADGDVPVMLQPLEPEGVVFRLEGTSLDFLIRSGKPAQKSQGEDKTSVMSAMQNADGTYVLPGSSLKGVLRSRAELIASCLRVSDVVETLFGRTAQGADDGMPGHVIVREFTLQKPSRQVITRTKIDRFTGGVMPQHLFSEERLADRVVLEASLTISDASACGILFYTLRDLAMGLYGFGSGTSTGRGVLEADNSRLTVRCGQRTCLYTFADGKTISKGDEEMIRQWLTALQERSGGAK